MTLRFVTPEAVFARLSGVPGCLSLDEIVTVLGGRAPLSADKVLALRIPWERRLWLALHPMALSEVELMACALAFARYALDRYGKGLPEPQLFREALAVYEAWLRDEATTAERDAACAAVADVCRSSIGGPARSQAVDAGWAVVGAGLPQSFEAARVAAKYAREAAASPIRAARDQVELVRGVLTDGAAARYRRDVAACETGADPALMDSHYICKATIANQTAGTNATPVEYVTNKAVRGIICPQVDTIKPGSSLFAVMGVGVPCSGFGTIGTVTYWLRNRQTLVLKWSVPDYRGAGTAGRYFYALLQGTQAGQYQVEVSNLENLDYCGDSYVSQIEPLITLSNFQ